VNQKKQQFGLGESQPIKQWPSLSEMDVARELPKKVRVKDPNLTWKHCYVAAVKKI